MAGPPVSPAGPYPAARSGEVRSLVLRAWLESGIPPRLRARVVEVGPGPTERPVVVAASIDEACRAVRSWLENLQTGGAGGNGDGTVTQKG
jgi:hypothetical protein